MHPLSSRRVVQSDWSLSTKGKPEGNSLITSEAHKHSVGLSPKCCKQGEFQCFISFLISLTQTPLSDAEFLEVGTIFFILCLPRAALKIEAPLCRLQSPIELPAVQWKLPQDVRGACAWACHLLLSLLLQGCAELASSRVKCC